MAWWWGGGWVGGRVMVGWGGVGRVVVVVGTCIK